MDELNVIFEEQRTHLRAVAYRPLVVTRFSADGRVQVPEAMYAARM